MCTRVRAMLADKPDKLRGAKKIIDEIERGQGIEYAPLQRQAVELAAQEELLILTGGPGTGKTTSVRGIVALFERMGLDVLLCAPTGRAAKRMGELCGKEAQTIHRLLGMSWNEQTGDVTFTKNEKEPLEADAVIVDETSMVDLALMRARCSRRCGPAAGWCWWATPTSCRASARGTCSAISSARSALRP